MFTDPRVLHSPHWDERTLETSTEETFTFNQTPLVSQPRQSRQREISKMNLSPQG